MEEDGGELKCPNCSTETYRVTTVCDESGVPFSFCERCPRPEVKKKNYFPAIITSKSRKTKQIPQIVNSKFDKYKLTPDQIAATQSQAPRVAYRDSPAARERDSVDGHRESVFVATSPERSFYRPTILKQNFIKKFGHDNFKIVYDDGNMKAIAKDLN